MTPFPTEFSYQPRLLVKGRTEFLRQTRDALSVISVTAPGKRLLQSLARSRQAVVILESTSHNLAIPDDFAAAIVSGQKLEWAELYGRQDHLIGTGLGSGTHIHFNPSYLRIGAAEDWQTAPAALWLAHELIHADDAAWGRMNPTKVDGVFHYERQAIGLPPYQLKELTENRFRANWMPPLPARLSY